MREDEEINVLPLRVAHHSFRCPYSGMDLQRPCEVTSCSYNLAENSTTTPHLRCFLHYCEQIRKKPGAGKGEHDFAAFPQEKKVRLAAQFFNTSVAAVENLNTSFYTALFSVFAEDVAVTLKKHQLEPVPFHQCAVCGMECEQLFIPKGSVLPSGFGYCSYACFQMKPPPVILLEKNNDLDFGEFVSAMEHESVHGRAKFVRQLMEWVLGNLPLRA